MTKKTLYHLAAELSTVQEKAKNFGIFTESRDLLRCLKCGLMEDVLCDGRLVTYYNGMMSQPSTKTGVFDG